MAASCQAQVIAASAIVLMGMSSPGYAQRSAENAAAYPTKSIRLVVPSAPGGGTDIIARLIGQELTEAWGQSVVVDNRGGSGGTVGVVMVARAAPDGYSMLLGSVGHLTFTPVVRNGQDYDPQKDLAPISLAANQPFVLAIANSMPATSVKELIALAKGRPGQIKYGSGGPGAASHLAVALLEVQAGISMLHVSYKGSNPALTAVVGGEIDLAAAGLATMLPHSKSGRVKAIAVTGSRRAQIAPEIPTVAESGVPGYAFDVWYGLVYTGGTPAPIIAKANGAVVKALRSPELNRRFIAAGLEALPSTPDEFRSRISSEIANWRKVVKAANIKFE